MGGHGRSGLLKVHAQLHIAKIEAIDVHRPGLGRQDAGTHEDCSAEGQAIFHRLTARPFNDIGKAAARADFSAGHEPANASALMLFAAARS